MSSNIVFNSLLKNETICVTDSNFATQALI